jgi:hypothetical protein
MPFVPALPKERMIESFTSLMADRSSLALQ